MPARFTVDLGVVAYAGMPVADGAGQTIGSLCVIDREPRQWTDRELAILGDLAAAVSAEVRVRAMGMTGRLPRPSDHGAFWEQLVLEITRARRHRRPLSVALIDLDHFTQINDRHGHAAGDVVLDEAADRLKAVIKHGQTLARVGGDTFAWIVPAATETAAASAVRRIVRAFASAPFAAIGVVTISAGVAELGDGVDADGLYAHAADALEHAKRAGRDRVCRYFNRPAPPRSAATISASDPSAERGSSPHSARRIPGARRSVIPVSPRGRPR